MKLLKNDGTFEIISKPENVIETIANAARGCYQTFDKSSPDSDLKLVRHLMTRNHTAMLEFGWLVVRFNFICRGFTHEQVRHRLASYAQESTRYVDESDLQVVVPPHKDENAPVCQITLEDGETFDVSLAQWFGLNEQMYRGLLEADWKKEDARQVLPIATKAMITVGANITEWRHIFKMRCDHYAHWEIRGVMLELLRWAQENIPVLFEDFHFFTTENGQEYARKIMKKSVLVDEMKHFVQVAPKEEIQALLSVIQDWRYTTDE